MAYILNKTNGAVITTVQDASLDTTTDLTFLGRNYAGYGEYQNENFLRLLENFANTTAPEKPIEGQLWYDSINNKVNVYDGSYWKSMGNLEVSETDPTGTKIFTFGDLWYNSLTQQLYVYNGATFILVGPPNRSDVIAGWRGDFEYSTAESGTQQYVIKAVVGTDNEVVAIASNKGFEISPTVSGTESPIYPLSGYLSTIYKGITLPGADPKTGRSDSAGYYFWGTAAHASTATTSTYAAYVTGGFKFETTATNERFNIPFITTSSNSTTSLAYVNTGLQFNPSTKTVYATASSALYSDLAERYAADDNYEPGTVLVIGGNQEVTISTLENDVTVAGIVSTKPAFRMNEYAGSDQSHPFIALKGRVPCKVLGPIKKGDLLVTSKIPGHGRSKINSDHSNAVFAKSLQDFEGGIGIIEVMVV